MRIVRSPVALLKTSRLFRQAGETIGFVPTMGALHEGHLSLVRRARRENDRVVSSIFVNPLQFGPAEDLASYPRPKARDHALLRAEKVDLLFTPEVERLYPPEFATRVTVEGLDQHLCGAFRPGHFTGVTTVVAKLLLACEPDRLYLGSKDYQQARILDRMVRDLNLGLQVVVCPTVREADGLAMSSRNRYLTPEERAWAPHLYQALRATAWEIRAGRIRRAGQAIRAINRRLAEGPGRLQYVEVLDAENLAEVDPLRGRLVLALAYFLGRARLIDNVVLRAPAAPSVSRRGRKGR